MRTRISPKSSKKLLAFRSRRFRRPFKPAKTCQTCRLRNLGVSQTQIPSLPSLPFSELVPIKHPNFTVKAGFHMSHFIVIHRISSKFRVYDQLGLLPIYENRPKKSILIHPNSSQFIATDHSESKNFAFCDEIGGIQMNYDSRFSYNLTITIMDIPQIAMKSDEMR